MLTLKTKAAPCPLRFVLQNDEGVLKINREKTMIIMNIKKINFIVTLRLRANPMSHFFLF